jgi:lycopene beta-cyclase
MISSISRHGVYVERHSEPVSSEGFDYVLVGGGLANGLIACALHARSDGARVALVEAGNKIGGNHTWSFHETDLDESARELVSPLVDASWRAHDVHFPARTRRVNGTYASLSSASLDSAARGTFARNHSSLLLLGETAVRLEEHAVHLAGGRLLRGRVVLDGRGVTPDEVAPHHRGGYQKFVGLELDLDAPCPRDVPLLMDASVEQLDGYRFVYVLPLGRHRALIEDTYYSLSGELNRGLLRERVLAYAALHGYRVRRVLREEHGVLPIPTHVAPRPNVEGPLRVGMRAGWFHPTTGYSLPLAARFAAIAASCAPEELPERAQAFSAAHQKNARFARFLNRLLFGAFTPTNRRHVLERFYGLPEDVIARFYALQSSRMDRAHILCGRPPRGFSVSQLLLGDSTV